MTQRPSSAHVTLGYLPKRHYYRHSGDVPSLGIIAGLGGGLVCAVAAALIYAYADLYIPIIYANLVLTGCFGALMGYVPARLMRAAKVRNSTVVLATVCVVTLAAYYLCWIFWLYALFQKLDHPVEFSLLFQNPVSLIPLIKRINEVGTWTMGHTGSSSSSDSDSTAVSGWFLWLVWAAEAATIFVCAILTARRLDSSLIFCDKCSRWSKPAHTFARTAPLPPADIKQRLEAGEFAFIPLLASWNALPGRYCQWDHQYCFVCNQLHTLTVKDVTMTMNKKGRKSLKTKIIVNKLILQPADVDAMKPQRKISELLDEITT